jgi:hypothetical protein
MRSSAEFRVRFARIRPLGCREGKSGGSSKLASSKLQRNIKSQITKHCRRLLPPFTGLYRLSAKPGETNVQGRIAHPQFASACFSARGRGVPLLTSGATRKYFYEYGTNQERFN